MKFQFCKTLILLVISLLIISCGGETYPIKYVYSEVDTSVSKIEAYHSSGKLELDRSDLPDQAGLELFLSSGLENELRTVFFIEEVSLESEEAFSMKINRNGTIETASGTYDKSNDVWTIDGESEPIPQLLVYEDGEDVFSFCVQLTIPRLASLGGGPDVRDCYTEDLDQIISDKNDIYNFSDGDTIAVFLPKFIYERS